MRPSALPAIEADSQALRFIMILGDGADRPALRRPAHAHVIGAGGEASFNLHCPDGPPELRESYGFRRHKVTGIKNALAGKIGVLCEEWEKIHGGQ